MLISPEVMADLTWGIYEIDASLLCGGRLCGGTVDIS
jgi:hypothetical protein